MIPYDSLPLRPSAPGDLRAQTSDILATLAERLRSSGRESRHVLALTFFVDAVEDGAYRDARDGILGLVTERLADSVPPVSVVAQAPEDARVALEAAVLSGCSVGEVRRGECEGGRYTVVTGGGILQVHGAGLASGDDETDPTVRSRTAFAKMEAVLAAEGLGFGHVVRQWGYLEGMLDIGPEELQGYQAFNDVRTVVYARSTWPTGYPSATGIGQDAGGIALEFLALEVPDGIVVEAVSNPRQIDAHRYSEGVLVGAPIDELEDASAPKFERAKRVRVGQDEVVFVSGTASILGEESVALGDVAAQTITTLDNMAALVDGRPLTRLRAYVKRAADIPTVREVCEARLGPVPALYVKADVCRDELLVELEGALVSSAAPGENAPAGDVKEES
jgi:enamine deaminase RidA (YjgF/YER057c/UK114 family)